MSYKEYKRVIDTLLLGTSLLNINGKCVATRNILPDTKYILFYFSASWCRTSSEILSNLKIIYNESIKHNMGLQIIYVSLDTQEKDMMKDFKENHGDWFTVPFGDIAIKNLCFRYGVTSLPYMVVVKKDGTIISRNVKQEMDKYGFNVLVRWVD